MADVKWIKITTDIFNNRKIRVIETMPEGYAIIVAWVKLLCLAGTTNDSGQIYLTTNIPYTEQTLAAQFNMPLATVQLALTTFEKFEMIERVDDFLKITNWEKYQNVQGLEKVREQTRNRVSRYRERQKSLPKCTTNDVTLQVTQGNATDIDIELDIDNIDNTMCIEQSKNAQNDVQSEEEKMKKTGSTEINELFERLWKLYPKKKGKGQISDAKKKAIYKIGYDEMKRAIDRYVNDLKKDSWRKAQNGSTFFNSGYIDYLDKNYVEDERTVKNDKYGDVGTIL
jgi:predicted phage replisome organizer